MASGPSTIELLVRLVFSLGVILGLLALGTRVARRNGAVLRLGGLGGLGARREAAIKVIDRTSLSRNASLAVVQVGGRTLVVGITEHGVSLLTDDVDLPAEDTERASGVAPTEVAIDLSGPLGLVGSPGTRPPWEAKGTTPPPPAPPATTAATDAGRQPRMSLVQALRELTVRNKP
jgi:flagellar biogenesis protein FliO